MAQSVNNSTTTYIQDIAAGLPQVLVETTQPPNHPTTYLYGIGRLAQVEDDSAEWFLGDALGSVRQLVDDVGNVVLAQAYDPYGQVLTTSGTSGSGYGFTGEQQDAGTGLVFLRARWYDSRTGRFISQDPFPGFAGLPQTLHPYMYCLDDPINVVDPSGNLGLGVLAWGGVGILTAPAWLPAVGAVGITTLAIIGTVWVFSEVSKRIGPFTGPERHPSPPSPDTRERRPLAGGDGATLSRTTPDWVPESLPRPTPPVRTFDPWLSPRSTPQPRTDPRLDPWLTPCPTVVATSTPRPEQRVTVYRGLDAKKGKPVYSPSQFRYDPDGVSMFELEYLPDNKPFATGFGFVISPPKAPGVVGQSEDIPGLTATYTPPPTGHWSIQHVNGAEYTKEVLSSNARLRGAIPNPNWIGE